MKMIFTILLITIGSLCYGQGISVEYNGKDIIGEEDSLTAERYIEDSIGNEYEIVYKFINSPDLIRWHDSTMNHKHVISIVSIIAFKGNKQ